MALRYRIVYSANSQLCKSKKRHTKTKYVISGLLAVFITIILAISPYRAKFIHFILPGDPVVTTNALQKLSETLGRGESLSNALDAFCETIMDER